MAKTTHYYPDALVVFVKGFRDVELATRDQLILAQEKDLISVSVTLTVANSPGSFSITLNDVANKFSFPDDKVNEIQNLKSNSEFQIRRDDDQRSFHPKIKGGLVAYEFDGFDTGKYPWVTFEYGTLVDVNSGHRTILYYRRLPSGEIAERYGFDEDGRVIRFTESFGSTAEAEDFFNDPTTNGQQIQLLVDDVNGKKNVNSTKTFILLKKKNEEFLKKYQMDVKNPLQNGRCRIEPMDRIAIFLSKRYEKDNNGNFNTVQTPRTELVRAFTGLVNTVQCGYNAQGGNTVTVTGEDVTKWLKVSVVPVNPVALKETDQTQSALLFTASDKFDLLTYTNIFKGIRTPDLIRLLTVGFEGLEKDARSRIEQVGGPQLRGVGVYSTSQHSTVNTENIIYDVNKGQFVVSHSNNNSSENISKIDIRGMLGSLFQKSSVHVIDPTETGLDIYLAYNTNFQMPTNYQTEYQNRRDICYKAASDSNFNFYADRNGHIWFHPPRFSNAWILGSENDKLQIIDEDSIISFGFVEDDSNVYSTAIISSEPDINKKDGALPGTEQFNRGSYTDDILTFKFGTKIFVGSNPFISKLGGGSASTFSSEPSIFYAKVMLQKMLANKMQGQVVITGRAEIDPGNPIYIPFRNMIYWVETVEHSLSFGGTFQTTLHLAYGRKPWESVSEIITQSFDTIHSTDGHINIVQDPSDNQPKTNNDGKRIIKKIDTSTLHPDKSESPVAIPQKDASIFIRRP